MNSIYNIVFRYLPFKYLISFLLLTSTLVLSGCTASSGDTKPDDKDQAKDEINFFDSEIFDIQVGLSLRSKLDTVTVKIITPFSTNKIPERIDKWLAAVSRNGGKVDVLVDPTLPKTRGIISEVIDLIFSLYDGAKQLAFYNASENYDAILYYDPKDGKVKRLLFNLKQKK